MVITVAIIAYVIVMSTEVIAVVRRIVIRLTKVKEITIGIGKVNAETPVVAGCINRTVEIVYLCKSSVLVAVQYPTHIIVTHIEQIIVAIHCPLFAAQNIVHQVANGVDKIVIDFVCIVALSVAQVQFVRHLIGKEASFFAYSTFAHACHTCATHGSHSDGK